MSREINAFFDNSEWYYTSKSGTKVEFTDGFGPYESLLGALAGCYYSTLEDIAKDKVSWQSVAIHVSGEKRSEVPTTLKETKLELTVKGVSAEELFKECAKEASNCCSIFQTIAKVSAMKLVINFK